MWKSPKVAGGRVDGAGTRAVSGPGTQARPETRCPRARGLPASSRGGHRGSELKLVRGGVCALGRARACHDGIRQGGGGGGTGETARAKAERSAALRKRSVAAGLHKTTVLVSPFAMTVELSVLPAAAPASLLACAAPPACLRYPPRPPARQPRSALSGLVSADISDNDDSPKPSKTTTETKTMGGCDDRTSNNPLRT